MKNAPEFKKTVDWKEPQPTKPNYVIATIEVLEFSTADVLSASNDLPWDEE